MERRRFRKILKRVQNGEMPAITGEYFTMVQQNMLKLSAHPKLLTEQSIRFYTWLRSCIHKEGYKTMHDRQQASLLARYTAEARRQLLPWYKRIFTSPIIHD